MAVNKTGAEKAIASAEREFRSAMASLEEKDYAGALKYLQECTEYAVKAVLLAYGVDCPKTHTVGRFLYEMREKYPQWFAKQIKSIADVADDLARSRARFRYPYEHPSEQYEVMVGHVFPRAKKALEDCRSLIQRFFG